MTKRKRNIFGLLGAAAILAAGAGWCYGQQTQPAASQPVTALRTWAVLASDELRKSGLEDQILAGLGTDRTITLVDREHLALVAKELALSGLLEAHDAGSRRKAGAAIRADALAILHLESAGGESFVRLVICETRAGARLAVECFPYKADHADEAGKATVAAIEQTRRRFRNGVQRVYAVAPFVSRDLGHQYDHLQRGCASLLGGALGSRDGVAVVEIDEARQIAREIGLTDGADIRRFVPLLIEGEYEVTRARPDKEPAVRFAVKVTGNGSPVNVPQRTVKLSEMAGYLSSDLPALILGGTDQQEKPLAADQQAAALVARADVFARLGAWEHSTGLREAALLLKDDPAQRMTLAGEYHKAARAPLPTSVVKRTREHTAMCGSRLRTWACALPHLAYMIRNEQLDAKTANEAIGHLARYEAMWHIRDYADSEDLDEAAVAKMRFVRNIWPALFKLKWKVRPFPSMTRSTAETLVLGTRRFDKAYLDFVYDLYENVTPQDEHHRLLIVYQFTGWANERSRSETANAGLDFYDRLAQSNRMANRLTGRLGRLCIERARLDPPEDLLRRVRALAAEYDKEKEIAEANPDHITRLDILQRELAAMVKPPPAAVTYVPPAQPATVAPKPPEPTTKPAEQVCYEPLELSVRTPDGKLVPVRQMQWKEARGVWNRGLRLVNCGEVDFYWRGGAVLLHRQKDILEEVIVDPNAVFADARWDGKHLWLAACSGSIRLLDKTGREVLRVTGEHGLPECDRTMLVYPLGDGKAIAAGCLGTSERMWIATVDTTCTTPKVTVFHRATRVKIDSDAKHDQEPDLAVLPIWICEYPQPKDEPRMLIMGRGSLYGQPSLMPLAIFPQTLKVGISPIGLMGIECTSLCRYGDRLLFASQGRPVMIGGPIPESLGNPQGWNGQSTYILNWNGYLYVTGHPWFRINPKDWRSEPLIPQRLPVSGAGQARWGASMHHGIICWSDQTGFYQVVFRNVPVTMTPQPSLDERIWRLFGTTQPGD